MYEVCQSVNFWIHAVEGIRAVSIPVDQAMQNLYISKDLYEPLLYNRPMETTHLRKHTVIYHRSRSGECDGLTAEEPAYTPRPQFDAFASNTSSKKRMDIPGFTPRAGEVSLRADHIHHRCRDGLQTSSGVLQPN